MSHEVSINQNGQAEMVSGRGIKPWHQDETNSTIVQGLMTAKEALQAAHLNWKAVAKPVSVGGIQLPFPTEENSTDCYQGICREDSGACLGVVKGRYEIIQNEEAFEFFDSIIGDGRAVYDTAGALRGGKQIWLLAKVKKDLSIAGDDCEQYALMNTSHNGSTCQEMLFVTCRVVCANTLSIALKGATNKVRIRHTKNWQEKKEQAMELLGLGNKYFETIQEALTNLSQKLLSPDEMSEFSKLLLPVQDGKELSTRTKNIRDEITRLFSEGDGNKGKTRWDALNAVSDYTDHFATLRGDNSTRLESALMKTGAELKQRAYELLSSESIMASLLEKSHSPILAPAAADTSFASLLARNL